MEKDREEGHRYAQGVQSLLARGPVSPENWKQVGDLARRLQLLADRNSFQQLPVATPAGRG